MGGLQVWLRKECFSLIRGFHVPVADYRVICLPGISALSQSLEHGGQLHPFACFYRRDKDEKRGGFVIIHMSGGM